MHAWVLRRLEQGVDFMSPSLAQGPDQLRFTFFFFNALGFLTLLLVVAAVVCIIRRRWYAEALLVVTSLGACGAMVYGVLLLDDTSGSNDTAGAILVVGGLAVLLGCAVAAKRWLSKRISGESTDG